MSTGMGWTVVAWIVVAVIYAPIAFLHPLAWVGATVGTMIHVTR